MTVCSTHRVGHDLVCYTVSRDLSKTPNSNVFIFVLIFACFRNSIGICLSLILVIWNIWTWANQTQSESISVIRGLGIQISSKTRMGRETCCLFDSSRIEDVVINEGISLWRVRYYLAIILKDSENLKLVFPETFPGIEQLVEIYHGTRALLFGNQELGFHSRASSQH